MSWGFFVFFLKFKLEYNIFFNLNVKNVVGFLRENGIFCAKNILPEIKRVLPAFCKVLSYKYIALFRQKNMLFFFGEAMLRWEWSIALLPTKCISTNCFLWISRRGNVFISVFWQLYGYSSWNFIFLSTSNTLGYVRLDVRKRKNEMLNSLGGKFKECKRLNRYSYRLQVCYICQLFSIRMHRSTENRKVIKT